MTLIKIFQSLKRQRKSDSRERNLAPSSIGILKLSQKCGSGILRSPKRERGSS